MIVATLGPFRFYSWRGAIRVPQVMREVIQQSGISGEIVYYSGLHSQPFSVLVKADFYSVQEAMVASTQIQQATFLDPLPLVKNGITYPLRFHILNVNPVTEDPVALFGGTRFPFPSFGIMVAQLDLQAVTPVVSPYV